MYHRLIAVTPSKVNKMPWEEVRRVCLDYTVTGLETISQLPRDSASKPLRFIYTSGANSQPDQSKKPWVLGDYSLMRVSFPSPILPTPILSPIEVPNTCPQGETESRVLTYARESKGAVDACVAKPGLIDAPGRTGLVMKAVQTVGRSIIGLPKVDVSEVAATLLDQAVRGFEKDTLLNEDLIRIGRTVLDQQKGT